TSVEALGDAVEIGLRVVRQLGALGEVLPQQAIRVLVRAALPGALWVAEVDLHVRGDAEGLMVRHLHAPIPGERAAKRLGQLGDLFADRRDNGRRLLALHLHQESEPGVALDQRRDVAVAGAGEQIAFPVAGDGPVFDRSWPVSDRHRVDDLPALLPRRRGLLRTAHPSPAAEMRLQLLLEHSARLYEQAAVDGLVRDRHVRSMPELVAEPARAISLPGPRGSGSSPCASARPAGCHRWIAGSPTRTPAASLAPG